MKLVLVLNVPPRKPANKDNKMKLVLVLNISARKPVNLVNNMELVLVLNVPPRKLANALNNMKLVFVFCPFSVKSVLFFNSTERSPFLFHDTRAVSAC